MSPGVGRQILKRQNGGNSSAFYGDGTKPFPSGQEYKQFVATKRRS